MLKKYLLLLAMLMPVCCNNQPGVVDQQQDIDPDSLIKDCPVGRIGNKCEQCAPGYYGNDCAACTCVHGVCDDGLKGSGTCVCAVGFAGSDCSDCASGYFGNECNLCDCGNGICNDGVTGDGFCTYPSDTDTDTDAESDFPVIVPEEDVDCAAEAVSCVILGINGMSGSPLTVAASTPMKLQAVALDANGVPLSCVKFNFSIGTSVTADGDFIGGDNNLLAFVVGNEDVRCQARVNLVPLVNDGLRIFVYDDNSGLPLSGVKIVLDSNTDYVETSVDGIVTLPAISTNSFTLSAFKEDYNYVTFARVNAKLKNIAIPLTAKKIAGTEAGGIKGKFSFDTYEKSYLPNGQHLFSRSAVVGNSIPLANLLGADRHTLRGGMLSMDDCVENPEQFGCYTINGYWDVLDEALVNIDGSVNTLSLPLPDNFVYGANLKPDFWVPAIPGMRLPWGLGGELSMKEVGEVFNLLIGRAFSWNVSVKQMMDYLQPLMSRLALAVGTVATLNPVDSLSDYEQQDLALSYKFTDHGIIKVNSLPIDEDTAAAMDGVLALRASKAKGFGLVPSGIGFGIDYDNNGKIDGAVICNGDDCVSGFDGKVAEGNVGLVYAPKDGALKCSEDLTIVAAVPLGQELLAGTGELASVKYGSLRLTANVIKGLPNDKIELSSADFIGIPSNMSVNDGSSYTFAGAKGADVNMAVLSGDLVSDHSTRWVIYSADDAAVVLPAVPAGMLDPNSVDAKNKSIIHVAVKLDNGLTYTSLLRNNGVNIDSLLDNAQKFSLSYPDYDAFYNTFLEKLNYWKYFNGLSF